MAVTKVALGLCIFFAFAEAASVSVNPAAIVDGEVKVPAGVTLANGAFVDSICFTEKTHVYKYTSTIKLKGSAQGGDHETVLSTDALVTCVGASSETKGAYVYDLQLRNLVVVSTANPGNTSSSSEFKDSDLASPFRYLRTKDGRVTAVKVTPNEPEPVKAIKKAITESLSTNFSYRNGKASVLETGITSERMTDYKAVVIEDMLAIEANYDSARIKRYAPGAQAAKDNARYVAHTDAVVDKTGIIVSSLDRTNVFSGNSATESSGPDLTINASADFILTGDIAKVVVPDASNFVTETLLGKVAPSSPAGGLQRRDAAADVQEVSKLVALLARNPADADSSRRLALLARSSSPAASHLLELSRRELRPRTTGAASGLFRRGRRGSSGHAGPVLSALAGSGVADAHFHLLDLAGDRSNDHHGTARAALIFAANPSREVVVRASDLAVGDKDMLLALGALLEGRPADEAAATMKPHLDAAIASNEESAAELAFLGIGNMGQNAAFAAEVLAATAADRTVSLSLRIKAVKALRGAAHLNRVRNALAAVVNAMEDDEDLYEAILFVHTRGTSKASSRNDSPDAFDIALRRREAHLIRRHHSAGLEPRAANTTDSIYTVAASRDWNSTASSSFDLIQPLSGRLSDTSFYATNIAGLAGVVVGWDKFNVQAAAGAFAGLGQQTCLIPDVKVLARARAMANAFGNSWSLVDAQANAIKDRRSSIAAASVDVTVWDKTLLHKDIAFTCQTWVFPLPNVDFPEQKFGYSLPVYVATVDVGLTLNGNLRPIVEVQACAAPSVKVDLKPTVNLALAGEGSVTVLVVRGKVDVTGSISYTIGPEIRALVPADGCSICASLNHGWDPATVAVTAAVETQGSIWDWFKGDTWKPLYNWNIWDYTLAGRAFEPIVPAVNWCFDPSKIFPPK
ncbi:hypothetical protein HDU96_000587 [Phlyctochytrium bullatum]|nr:hypothetical protein HDU96_000587 [Phlyctochytrium bullatum]